MVGNKAQMIDPLGLPLPRLCLAVSGHGEANAAFAQNREAIAKALSVLFSTVDSVTAAQAGGTAQTRLFSLLAHGADLMAVEAGIEHGWELAAPLPFGLDLNVAINAGPATAEEAQALRRGQAVADPALAIRASQIRAAAEKARLFELAEADDITASAHVAMLDAPADRQIARQFSDLASSRVAAAGRIMIEQSDLLVAIWDGVAPGGIGGTRHTILTALEAGTPVLWIDACAPERLGLLRAPEELFAPRQAARLPDEASVRTLIDGIMNPPDVDQNERAIAFHTEQWHGKSARRFHAYRRIEALFGGGAKGSLRQRYERPDEIATGSGAGLLAAAGAVPGSDPAFVARIKDEVLKRFAWADGLSTYLSDAYRGGMTTNFLLSAMAIIAGVSYLPLASVDAKWPFALTEFLLLGAIVAITTIGRRKRWHGRWFETRRVAEYFRHAPILLLLGVARASGRWPRGADTSWPELYAREVLRDLGLPQVRIDQAYLRSVLDTLLRDHAQSQRLYHQAKAQRLARVHHGLDRISERLFILAIISVASYLALLAAAQFGLVPHGWPHAASKTFTFLGVSLPALGGALAGIRYFGDFERFASISEITAEKLEAIEARIAILLAAPPGTLHYAQVAALAHSIDDVVVTEIENWQSVFGSKQIAVPV
jgi:hypothetical protein